MTQYDLYEFAQQFEIAFYFIGAAILLIEIAEALFKGSLKGKSLWEMAVSASTQIPSVLMDITILTAGYALFYYIAAVVPWDIPVTLWSIVLVIVLADFIYYWEHRIAHEVRILWTQHAVHHSSRDMNIVTGVRFGPFEGVWSLIIHLPMVFLFFISTLAETNRPPFDLPEAESELVAGYQVEYSSTLFLLFMAGEYIAIFLMCALISLLFFGGWLSPIPGLPDGALWLVAKMAFFFFLFAMVKAIVPRYRYDQLMRLGWKVFLPMSLAWVVIVAFLAKFEVLGGFWARWTVGG